MIKQISADVRASESSPIARSDTKRAHDCGHRSSQDICVHSNWRPSNQLEPKLVRLTFLALHNTLDPLRSPKRRQVGAGAPFACEAAERRGRRVGRPAQAAGLDEPEARERQRQPAGDQEQPQPTQPARCQVAGAGWRARRADAAK